LSDDIAIAPDSLTTLRLESPEALEDHLDAWDALAAAAGRPFSTPTWLLAWWRCVAPTRARLFVVAVFDGEEMIGLAPYHLVRDTAGGGLVRCRPLGVGSCARVEPLAAAGREIDVAIALTSVLAATRPAIGVMTFEGSPPQTPWPRLLADAWPGSRRPWLGFQTTKAALSLELQDGDFDTWFANRSKHFRKSMRKQRRDLDAAGGAFRLATPERAEADLETFARLHHGRWSERGGSEALNDRVQAALSAAAPTMVRDGRMQIWTLEVEGRPAAASVVFAAGEELGYWLTGFDEDFAALSPARLSVLHVIEDAFERGAARVDLGEGLFPYKRRFSENIEELEWRWLVPPGPAHALGRASVLPSRVRWWLSRTLSAEHKAALRRVLRTVTPATAPPG